MLTSVRHGLRTEIDLHLNAEGIAAAPRLELDSPAGLAAFVACSDLFTIRPSLAVSGQLQDDSLRAYRIVTPRITRQLVAVHLSQRPMTAASTRLLDVLGEELRDMSPQLQAIIDGEV